MLVKQSIVERWYQRDSWVYKNFSFLFQNPLWTKQIPQGFSVCPYFWLNLFSLFIFRPFFVAPIQYVFRPLIKLFGKPAAAVDKFLFNALPGIRGHYFVGYGFLVGLLYSTLATLSLILMVILWEKTYFLYKTIEGIMPDIYFFWSAISFAALLAIIGIHKLITRTKCKTGYYLAVWVALFIVSLFVVVPHQTISFVCGLCSAIGLVIWHVIVYIVSNIGWGLGQVCVYIWGFLKSVLAWKPLAILFLPWWAFIVFITILGWLSEKILNLMDKQSTTNLRKNNPDELYAKYRDAWLDLFVKIILKDGDFKSGSKFQLWFGKFLGKAVNTHKYRLIRKTFNAIWGAQLDILQKDYPFLSEGWYKVLDSCIYMESRFNTVRSHMKNDESKSVIPEFDMDKFRETFSKLAINEPEVSQLAQEYSDKAQNALIRQETKKASWAHVTCLKVTGAIADNVTTAWNGLVQGVKWTWNQVSTLAAYLGMLVKAKKQGACPYFRFTDGGK